MWWITLIPIRIWCHGYIGAIQWSWVADISGQYWSKVWNLFFSPEQKVDPQTISPFQIVLQINPLTLYFSCKLFHCHLTQPQRQKNEVLLGLRSKNKPHPNICINIDGETINETAKTKFLGVIIDNKLSWKDHILYISGKLARGTGVLLKVRRYLMKETLISLYYSFVYPYLIYCNHVWGLACKTHMNTLFLLQKRIIRIIAGVNRRSHTDPIFKELKLLKCNDINTYLIGRLMHRIYNGDITLLRSNFKKNKEVHQYGTRQINHYHVPPVKTELGKSALRFHGVVIWNKILNLGMDPVMTDYEFSKSLKNHLLQDML